MKSQKTGRTVNSRTVMVVDLLLSMIGLSLIIISMFGVINGYGSIGWNLWLLNLGVILILLITVIYGLMYLSKQMMKYGREKHMLAKRIEFQKHISADGLESHYVASDEDIDVEELIKIRQRLIGSVAYCREYNQYMVIVSYNGRTDWKFCYCNVTGKPTSTVVRCTKDIDDFRWENLDEKGRWVKVWL